MDVTKDADVEVLLFGLSSYYAAVATIMVVYSQTMDAAADVAAATIAVYGLSFFSSSAVADVAVMVAASSLTDSKMATVHPSPLFVSFLYEVPPVLRHIYHIPEPVLHILQSLSHIRLSTFYT